MASSQAADPIVPSDPSPTEPNKVVPLSGNPYFTKIIALSQVECPFQMTIPSDFHSFLAPVSVPVVLSCGNKTWEMKYHGNRLRRRFDGGWKQFAVDNNLKIGDGCVFELMDNTKKLRFKVQIISGEISETIPSYFHSFLAPVSVPVVQTIPTYFHSFLAPVSVPVVLSCGNNTWEMKYHGNRLRRRFDGGWKQFAVDNNLKIGDGCVFELMDNTKKLRFKVQIISGEIPEVLVID